MPNTTTVTVQIPKSIGLAYVLWFFFGQLGIHRFYLKRTGTGIVQLILGVLGWILSAFGIGFVLLGILWLWLLIDIFLIPGMARSGGGTIVQATTVTSDSMPESTQE